MFKPFSSLTNIRYKTYVLIFPNRNVTLPINETLQIEFSWKASLILDYDLLLLNFWTFRFFFIRPYRVVECIVHQGGHYIGELCPTHFIFWMVLTQPIYPTFIWKLSEACATVVISPSASIFKWFLQINYSSEIPKIYSLWNVLLFYIFYKKMKNRKKYSKIFIKIQYDTERIFNITFWWWQ